MESNEQPKKKKGPKGSFFVRRGWEGRGQEAKTGREQRQGTAFIQSVAHRGTVCTFVRQKYQKRGGFRNAPSTSEGSALREPRAMQSNGVLAYALPSAARRQTPARCCTRCPAYAPAIKSPARYSAGRAKQHNHARNVKPFPLGGVRGEPSPGRRGAGSARCLFRPIFLCCSLYHAPGLFPCLFIFSLAGPARRRSPARFLLAKKGRFLVPLCAVV